MAPLNETVRAELAGAYFDFQAEARAQANPNIGGSVGTAVPSDWGPTNSVVPIVRESDITDWFGDSDTDLTRSIRDALKGQGTDGKAGAGRVLAYRQAASGAAKATKILQNTASATAMTLTAKYVGTRANKLKTTVQAAAGGGQELLILDGNRVVERYEHTATDITSVVAAVNLKSSWFTATLGVSGVALGALSGTAVTGGTDGDTITGTEWTATFAAFERWGWAVFAPYGLVDPTIRASYITWIKTRNIAGTRCWGYTGGAAGETYATGNTRSTSINDYNIINLVGDVAHLVEENIDISMAKFVSRAAGARARRGERSDDIYVRFGGVELAGMGASEAEQITARRAGSTVLVRDTHPTAPVHFRESVTTYTDDSLSPTDSKGNKHRPVVLYRCIKSVAIQHAIETEIRAFAVNGDFLGELGNTQSNRDMLVGRVRLAYGEREEVGIVQPGWFVKEADDVSDDDDFVSYVHGFKPVKSIRQMFNVVRIAL